MWCLVYIGIKVKFVYANGVLFKIPTILLNFVTIKTCILEILSVYSVLKIILWESLVSTYMWS